MAVRPLIAIPARFAQTTSATGSSAVVLAESLVESLWLAGAEPVGVYPVAGCDWGSRLASFSGIVLPGGGDLSPSTYGQELTSAEVYGVNELQDQVDFEIARWAISAGIPLLAICRGCQLVNVALGGTLIQHMTDDHRDRMHEIIVDQPVELGIADSHIYSSCYHHQAIDRLGDGLEVIARSVDGVIEGVKIPSKGWAYGLQWHPEHTAADNPDQLAVLKKFVAECSKN
jgi:putative glutamine amidotransferase